jgi:hypothetical protein
MSKQKSELSKTLRGEAGRFLTESKEVTRKSTNIPMVQWSRPWYYGRCSLNGGDLERNGFETRIVYHSRSKVNAGLVEKGIQGE